MPARPIQQLGAGGVVKDTPSVQLGENMFTEMRNMRTQDNAIEAMKGEALRRTQTNNLPEYGLHWRRPDQGYDIYLQDGKAVRVDAGGSESFMLNSVAAQYANSVWQTDFFNGGYAVVINNGKSTPLYALFGDPVAGSTFQPFPNWNHSGLTIFAKVIRSLGYSLVAMNLTIDDGVTITSAPSTVRISVQAATGAFPDVWVPGLTTDTADEFEVNSTSPLLDGAELRGNMFLYSSDTIHVLNINSGSTRVAPYAKGYGILNTGCVVEFDGNHFVVDRNDIYAHNGSGLPQSLADKKVRKYFFSNLNKDFADLVFLQKHPETNEIWVCYPKGASEVVNEAMIFNYKEKTWQFRDLTGAPVSMFPSYGVSGGTYQYAQPCVLQCLGTATVLRNEVGYQMWDQTEFYNYSSYVERVNLFSGDALTANLIKSMTPIVETDQGALEIQVAVVGKNTVITPQDLNNPTVRQLTKFIPFDPRAQGYKVDPRSHGRFFSYRMTGTGYWRIALLGLEVATPQGAR
jgi:hypothetical protein